MGLSEAITDPKTLSANEPSETIARLQLDKYQARDPRRIAIFRSLVSQHWVDEAEHLDEQVRKWTECVQDAASQAFAPDKRKARRPWLTPECWQAIDNVRATRFYM